MNTSNILTVLAGLMLTAPLAAQANNPDSIENQIKFYEYSITQSSVSPTLSEQRKSEKLGLLDMARNLAALGNERRAEAILNQIAEQLYPVPTQRSAASQEQLDIERAHAISKAMASILPQAHQIALEKQADQSQLHRLTLDHQVAKSALESNDMSSAHDLLLASYREMKHSVANLRSGDRLFIELPQPDSREGWMDAASRYLDWRYFNRQLLAEMENSNQFFGEIDQANRDADQLYDLASSIALQGDWAQAVDTVDQAFAILEKAWRDIGIDVGV